MAPRRLSLWAAAVEPQDGGVTVRGEVWLGPVDVGDRFTIAATGLREERVDLAVAEISAPPEAQEPGRVLRVAVELEGEGVQRLVSGMVLLGESDD